MDINSETVLNGTKEVVDTTLGQIRVIETNNELVVEHHVTECERLSNDYLHFSVKTAQSTLEMCRVAFEAKKFLSKSEYSHFLKAIGHSNESPKIRKLIAIGEQYDKLIQYTNLLPSSWTSIYTITLLSPETFGALADTDTDMSNMTGKDLESLRALNKPKPTAPSATSACSLPNSSTATTQVVPASSVQSFSNAKQEEIKSDSDVEQDHPDAKVNILSSYNNAIDVVSADGTYEVLVRFKSKPSDDSWWDLTDAIEGVVDRKNLNVEIIETRPPFEELS